MLLRRLVECLIFLAIAAMGLMSLIGAVDPLFAAPATPAEVTVPVDKAARAKFPRAGGEMIDALAFINKLVNASIEGVTDKDHYGVDDLWVMYPKDGKGDCEDYALSKLGILEQSDYPVVDHVKLVGVAFRYRGEALGHMILAVRLPTGDVAYLDNRFSEPMTRSELVKAGYIFFDWRA